MVLHLFKSAEKKEKNMSPILITGATGSIGTHLISLLLESGHPVRALVRDRARAAGFPDEVEVVVGDLEHPQTLPAAFAGVERVFLMDPSHGRLDLTRNAVAAAREAGVQRIVNLSSIGAEIDSVPIIGHAFVLGRAFAEREALIRESGIAWTFLHPSTFMSNTLWWLPSLKAEGVVRDPIGPGRTASIDPDDIAAVAAVALTQEGHAGQTYTLTGSELMTVRQQVEILAGVLGRTIEYIEITPEEAAQAALAHGMDSAAVDAIKELDTLLRANAAAVETSDVQRVTGSPPVTFERWCRRNAAAFA
jgi:uncharacterized protein YbjT (DUF2867 family)